MMLLGVLQDACATSPTSVLSLSGGLSQENGGGSLLNPCPVSTLGKTLRLALFTLLCGAYVALR